MDTRTYLSQLKNLDNRIKNLLKECERWYDIATSTGGTDYSAVKVQTSLNTDRIGDVVGKVVDYQRECKNKAEEYIRLRKTIIEQIESLKGEEIKELYYNILYGYYVDDKSFDVLLVENHYSYRQMKRHYSKALELFENMYGYLYLELE